LTAFAWLKRFAVLLLLWAARVAASALSSAPMLRAIAWFKRFAVLLLLWPVCVAASALSSALMLRAIIFNHDRAWRQAISYDQLANAATGGSEDETISSRANRAESNGRRWGCVLCRLLDKVEKDHCRKSAGT
jgi:DNA polymerase III delta prime subunit